MQTKTLQTSTTTNTAAPIIGRVKLNQPSRTTASALVTDALAAIPPTATSLLPIRPVNVHDPFAPRPIDSCTCAYVMNRFIATYSFLDHTLNETIGVVGGADERHRCEGATTNVKVERLRQLMVDRNIISETDQEFTQLLDEYLRVDEHLKSVHKVFYIGAHGALVADFEDAIYVMRKAASDLNAAIVRGFPGHVPDYDRPSTTLDEDTYTGRDQGPLTELVISYLFPDHDQSTDECQQD
jgi:hypothetical protein